MADDNTNDQKPDDQKPDDQQQSDDRGRQSDGQKGDDGESVDDLRKRLADLESDRDKWRASSRRYEQTARQNADDAKAKATVEEQVEALRKDIAQRDADAVTERADQAAEKLQAKLVRGGLSDEDATTLVGSIDPMRLLSEGKPDTGEIDKLAKSLIKIGTRPAPDSDQGRKGGDAPPSMNQLIREAAKRTTVSG